MLSNQKIGQERFDVLLAMGIAFSKRASDVTNNSDETANDSKKETISESISQVFESLETENLASLRKKIEEYEALSPEEKKHWQSRILKRIKTSGARLDKDVHYTQIAEVLKGEPIYIRNFILKHLPGAMVASVNSVFDSKSSNNQTEPARGVAVHPNIEALLRQRFLSNFVVQEDLSEVKPLSLLSGKNLLLLLQQLGRDEIAIVCRGIKDIENLASFLRMFDPVDAQAIVERVATLRTIEKKRINKAESLVKEIWQSEINPSAIVQIIGIHKLAAALACKNDLSVRYTMQKLAVDLALKLHERVDEVCEKIQNSDVLEKELAEIFASEVETAAARLLLDQMQKK
jgi:hypothetical protein